MKNGFIDNKFAIRVVRDKSLEQMIYECGLRLLLILLSSYCDKQVLRTVDILLESIHDGVLIFANRMWLLMKPLKYGM
jgi:hypothetical protein